MLVVNIACVNVLAFIGGIGLAATQSQSLPSEGDTLPQSKLQQVVSPAATPSEDASVYSFRRFTTPLWGGHVSSFVPL